MTTHHFSRRTLLRGLGVSMALPWLESLPVWGDEPAKNTKSSEAPVRLAVLFSGNGNRGNAYQGMAQWAKAAADYAQILELEPQNAEARHMLASCHVQLGRYQEALDGYRQLVERFPQVALPHNDLAWFLATCPDTKFRDPGRAVELAKKAVELAPKQGAYWNTLGIAQYRLGNLDAAIEALKKSEELLPGQYFSFNAFFLAMTHWQSDNKEEARKWFDQAVEWMEKNKPQDEELKRFRAEAAELLGVKEKQ